MKIRLQLSFIIAFFFLFSSCKRSTHNPCDGLMNESPPLRIGVVLLDKNTGENLLKTKVFTADDIKITLAETGKPFNSWRIVTTGNFPVEGLLEFSVFHGTAAAYGYKIELKNTETINLSYLIKEEKTNDPCKIYYYPMSDLKVLNRDFEYLKYNDKTFPNVVVVKLDRK